MMRLVLDSSVILKWFLPEPDTPVALRLLDVPEPEFHAPDLYLIEADNAIVKRLRRKEISIDKAQTLRLAVRRVPIQPHAMVRFLDLGFEIAKASGASLYDAVYVALAVSLGIQVVTGDDRMVRAITAGGFGAHVCRVADLAVAPRS